LLRLFQNLHFSTRHQQIHLQLIFFHSFSFSFRFLVYKTFASVLSIETSSFTCSSISPSKILPAAFSAGKKRSIVSVLASTSSSSKSRSSSSNSSKGFFLACIMPGNDG